MDHRFDKRYFFLDFARGRSLHKEEMQCLLQVLERAGYNGLFIHLEGFFETTAYPGLVREGALSAEDARWLCREAREHGIRVSPVINLVGHAESFVYYQERFAAMRRDDAYKQLDLRALQLMELAHTMVDELAAIYEPEYIHVGGDECTLDEEERQLYVTFLSQLCAYVSSKGITPCIYSDMLYTHREMAQTFTRDVAIVDWFYNGHREDSLRYFQQLGFREVFASPCDQGWDGFIGAQRIWRGYENVVPVEVDEIEALLSDAYALGIGNALITNYENRQGHHLWANMNAIVRAGLYMSGREWMQESIECCLFGRQTPFSQATHALQEAQLALYDIGLDNDLPGLLRCRISDALYEGPKFHAMVAMAPKLSSALFPVFSRCFAQAEALLEGWEAIGETEGRCKRSLQAALQYGKALFALLKLGADGYAAYHAAAMCQFEDTERCVESLQDALGYVQAFADAVDTYVVAQKFALADNGEIKADTALPVRLAEDVRRLGEQLQSMLAVNRDSTHTAIPVLPSFCKLLYDTVQLPPRR